jgi:nucleoid-associated protein YgaU
MGKDYKIGLMCGLVAAVVLVIWMATRPSLNTRARMFGASALPPETSSPGPQAPDLIGPSGQTSPGRSQTAGTPLPPPRAEPPRTEAPRVTELPQAVVRQADAAPSRTHIVQSRETLSSISLRYYGTPDAWQRIVRANADVIKNPNMVPVGTKLVIP